jgi:YcxB-like protein
MGSDFDPYAPPRQSSVSARPPSAEVLASCTVLVTMGKQTRRRRIAQMVRRLIYPMLVGFMGFEAASAGGIAVQVLTALACGWLVWVFLTVIGGKKRPRKQTFAYRFYDDGFDVETEGSLTRVQWASIYHFVDGADGFVLHNGSVHAFPTSGLPSDDVVALRALFATKITSGGTQK